MANSTQGKNIQKIALEFINPILTAILVGLVVWGITLVKEFEHRLTELETKFNICVDCTKRTKEVGGLKIDTYPGQSIDEKTGTIDLEVDIDILSEQCRWVCGSSREIVQGGEPVDFDKVMQAYVNTDQLKGISGIICVGAASSEGIQNNEEQRASDRMEYLINLVRNNIRNDTIPIYGFNIGQYVGANNSQCSDNTLDQRRIILFKVLKKDSLMSNELFERKLRTILIQKAADKSINFPIDIRKYSKFQNSATMLTVGRKGKSN